MDTALFVTIFVMILSAYGFIIKFIISTKTAVTQSEFDKHKAVVQYKDTCGEIVRRIDEKADGRHQELKEDMAEIKNLIRNGGRT
jgi:hypothetical protein